MDEASGTNGTNKVDQIDETTEASGFREIKELKEWMSIKEAAEYLGVHEVEFRGRVRQGYYPVTNLPGYRRQIRISRTRLDEYLRALTVHEGEEIPNGYTPDWCAPAEDAPEIAD